MSLCAPPLLVCGRGSKGSFPLCILRMVNERTPVQPPHGEGRLAPEDATGLLCAPPLLVCGRGSKGSIPLSIPPMVTERTLCSLRMVKADLRLEDPPGLPCALPCPFSAEG